MPSRSERHSCGLVVARSNVLRQAERVAGTEVDPVDAVADFLRHPADVAADDRAPWKKASWITSGEFSHQIEGTTTQCRSAISFGSSPCS